MKRLMVALTLLAGFSMAAQAEEKTLDKTANFENRTAGEAFDITKKDDPNDYGVLWSRVDPKTGVTLEDAAAAGESTVEAYAVAPAADNKNYLHIDESNVLTRKLYESATISQYGYVKVASKVQFTAQDDDTTPAVAPNSKLAMWLKRTEVTGEEVTKTNYTLMVRANKDVGTKFVATNYEFQVTGLAENTWYDLEVQAVKVDNTYAAFNIKVGNTTLENPDGGPFMSLDQDTTAWETITSIGFQGVGAVDDLVFSSEEGEVPPEPEKPTHYAVTIEPEEATEVMDTLTYTVDDGDPVDFDTEGFDILTNSITSIKINAIAVGYEDYEKTYSKDEFSALKGQLTITLTPSEPGGDLPSFIDPKDTENAELYTAWATTYEITDPSKVKQDAFLLNCDNTDEAIADAKKEFTIKSIEIDADGNVTVVGPDQEDYNGTVVLKGSAEVDGEYTKEAVEKKTAKFFKAFLEYIPAN